MQLLLWMDYVLWRQAFSLEHLVTHGLGVCLAFCLPFSLFLTLLAYFLGVFATYSSLFLWQDRGHANSSRIASEVCGRIGLAGQERTGQ